MFRDLVAASKCGRGKTGTLNELYEGLAAKGVTPLKPSGFVFHESRVGSTLVANMLASARPPAPDSTRRFARSLEFRGSGAPPRRRPRVRGGAATPEI